MLLKSSELFRQCFLAFKTQKYSKINRAVWFLGNLRCWDCIAKQLGEEILRPGYLLESNLRSYCIIFCITNGCLKLHILKPLREKQSQKRN